MRTARKILDAETPKQFLKRRNVGHATEWGLIFMGKNEASFERRTDEIVFVERAGRQTYRAYAKLGSAYVLLQFMDALSIADAAEEAKVLATQFYDLKR